MNNDNNYTYFENMISINSKNIELFYCNDDNISNWISKLNYNNEIIEFICIDKYNSERLLNPIYDFHVKTKIPIIISIQYFLWNNKDLNRFRFLSSTDIENIKLYDNYNIMFSTN